MKSMEESRSAKLIQANLRWLKEKVFPKWTAIGLHKESGLFVESLTFEDVPFQGPHRAMVQARQIYSFSEACRMELLDTTRARETVKKATDAFLKYYLQPNGSVIHSIDLSGKPVSQEVDLYTQAFALFALSYAYQLCAEPRYKEAALKTLKYLKTERQNPAGGYTEIKNSQTLYQSNPHMHLFESMIAWSAVDSDSNWKEEAAAIYNLCQDKFIQKEGLLAEHFQPDWKPQLENNRFLFEPGHHYEWCWLFHQYKKYCESRASVEVATTLFDNAEKEGLSADGRLVYDEIWSDGNVKKKSSRFWPQSERIKAAVMMNKGAIADQALETLMDKFLLIDQGLWRDTLKEDGSYADVPAKASSLYHILNAISEYVKYRPRIGE